MELFITYHIERDDEEIELHVVGCAEPWVSGRRGHIDDWTPDEGGYATIEGIWPDEDQVKPWDGVLTKKETADVEAALMDALADSIRDRQESAAEDRADARREADYDHYDQDYGDYGPDINDF